MDSKIIFRLLLIIILSITTHINAIEFKGKFLQGHYIIGLTDPSAQIIIGNKKVKVSDDGYFVFGIDRDRKFDLIITKIQDGKKEKIIKKVLKRKYNIQRIDGLEESKKTVITKLSPGSTIVANNYFWLHGRKPFKENKDLSRELLRIRGKFF